MSRNYRFAALLLLLLAAAPALAAQATTLATVAPNPLPVGTDTVTLTGTGFTANTLVYDSFGSNNGIQYGPTSWTPTTLTVTIYQGQAATSSFCVKNPGYHCSAAVSVPVGAAASGGSGGSSGGSNGSGSGSGGSAAPVLNAVNPNPLAVGTDTVTLTGSGFTASTLVYDSYGTTSAIQYAPLSWSATTITVSIYQGAAANSTFCVGSSSNCSNAITVPVGGSNSGTGGSGSGGSGSGGTGGSGGGSGGASAPVLTAVGPNPLPVGTDTVTLTGTGFTAGTLVYNRYGSGSYIQYAPLSWSANTITASIYQGQATSSTFCVGSLSNCSNAITVPVSGSNNAGGGNSGGGSPATYTLTLINGTLTGGVTSGTYAAGASVAITANPAPAGQYFQQWTGSGLANSAAAQTTVTMPAANTTETASYFNPPPIPFPVTTHPRLWITQQHLPRLQSWATSNNQVYTAIHGLLGAAIGNYQLAFPGAQLTDVNPTPASPYPDFGDTQGYTGILSEENAFVLALHSLIDPNPANRIAYAQAARNLIMVVMNQAALGHANNVPFRDPLFVTYNRGSLTSHEWPLIVDWIYDDLNAQGQPILSAQDKATIRTVFLLWAGDCINANTTGGDHPTGPVGTLLQSALLPNGQAYRYASNNYYLAHARLLTLMSLAMDPGDDPQISLQAPPSQIGNSLRSYISDATGAWLLEEYAMMGDAPSVVQNLHLANNPNGIGLGLASGGLPPEGMLYGESYAYILGQLLGLQTAGFNDPSLSGPQIALIGAPVWDRYIHGYLSSLTPAPQVPANENWLGSVFQLSGYGDMLRNWVSPDAISPLALLALIEQENGQSTHVAAARWFALNGPANGPAGLVSRVADPWTWGVTPAVLNFLLLDPTAPAPADPRPAFPTLFYDPPAGRVIAHSDWTPGATEFDYRASWISINHQDGGSGQFSFYRKGEWLTKELSNYDNNWQGQTTPWHNTLAIQNACTGACVGNPPAFLNWFEPTFWTNGSQWMEGEASGDPATVSSSGPGYVYAASDLTKLFNRVPAAGGTIANVTQATRNILWLNNDYIIVYDRATTQNGGLFKRFNLSLPVQPVIQGSSASATLADGQQLFVQTLLPQAPQIGFFDGTAPLSTISDLETMHYILTVEDPGLPADSRLLHVLQGADPGAPKTPATYIQSLTGDSFDGAVLGATVVYFAHQANLNLQGATLPVPVGVGTVFVAGLTPGATYTATAGNGSVMLAPGGSLTADAAGVLVVPF